MDHVKTLTILGVTGSVGQSTADVVASAPARFDVDTVTAQNDVEGLAAAALLLKARCAIIGNAAHEEALRAQLKNTGIAVLSGADALAQAVKPDTDITMAAISGMAGLKPLMGAIKNSKVVAIANKEPLVAAGALVLAEAQKYDTKILPVDSEHNAVFQVLDPAQCCAVKRIILTASGGPFLNWSAAQVAKATPAQAVAHPNWDMGAKISVDSASMMNKALEIIEAHMLFAIEPAQIDVVIHPQSVVHSMVEYTDGSILAQMGASDMRTPIAYALAWPERMETPGATLDLAALSRLDFQKADHAQFPALGLAYDAIKAGPGACLALNAANEVAVEAFLRNEIDFPVILDIARFALTRGADINFGDLDSLMVADQIVRQDVLHEFNLSEPRAEVKKKAV